jgi:hypothetical protein
MAKLRGWFCNTCKELVCKVGKGQQEAHEAHKKECAGDERGLVTYSLKNTRG